MEVALFGLGGDADHGRAAELGGEVFGASFLGLEFDDAEEAVSEVRVALGNEAGELVFAAVLENPFVDPVGGEDGKEGGTAEKDGEAEERRGGEKAVEEKDEEKREEKAQEPGDEGLDYFNSPELGLEGV